MTVEPVSLVPINWHLSGRRLLFMYFEIYLFIYDLFYFDEAWNPHFHIVLYLAEN